MISHISYKSQLYNHILLKNIIKGSKIIILYSMYYTY